MTKKGWFSSEQYKVEGVVEQKQPGNEKPTVLWKIEGHWNKVIRMAPVIDGEVDELRWEVIFEKEPYPANYELQYGMTRF